MSGRSWIGVVLILVLLMVGLWFAGGRRNVSPGISGVIPLWTDGFGMSSSLPSSVDPVVSAKGIVVPVRYARHSFSTSGLIAQIAVKEGAAVKAGDVLAQLDNADLKLQVKAAQDLDDLAKVTLAQVQRGASPEEITAAETNLRNAQAQYERVKQGPSDEEKAILQANLDKATAVVASAQTAYDRVGGANNPEIGMLPQSLQLQQAKQDYEIARANFAIKKQVDPAALAAAQAAVENARVALAAKKNGAPPTDVAAYEIKLRQADTALAQAQAHLSRASLLAAFDGIVTNIASRAGEMATAGVPVLTVADLSQLRVETTDLDEWGAARVKLGQAAKVTVSAFPSKTLTGRVVNIASQYNTLPSGSSGYVVTITLDQQDPEVRWGMTVKVDFQK